MHVQEYAGKRQGRATAPTGDAMRGSSLVQMGEYFEILAARVDPGRIRKRPRMRKR
jgi:hypothetical protein